VRFRRLADPIHRQAAPDRRVGGAWLAILALLIGSLLPTAIAAAAAPDGGVAAIGSCGGGSGAPVHQSPAPPQRHCALCLIAAIGGAPIPAACHAAAAAIESVAALPAGQHNIRAPSTNTQAQPRAPPAAG